MNPEKIYAGVYCFRSVDMTKQTKPFLKIRKNIRNPEFLEENPFTPDKACKRRCFYVGTNDLEGSI